MAKNKNRKQAGRQEQAARGGTGEARSAVTEGAPGAGTSADGAGSGARGKQRRFGHN